jgi:hypothetical protein
VSKCKMTSSTCWVGFTVSVLMKTANSYLPHLIRDCSRLQQRMLKTCLYGQWDGEFFIAKTHNNTQYKQWQITSGTGVWVLIFLQMWTANSSCLQWIWSLQQFEAFINTHLFIWTFMCGEIYTSTRLATHTVLDYFISTQTTAIYTVLLATSNH